MTTLLNVAAASFAVTALALTGLGVLAWHRSRRAKTGVLAGGFALFAASGGLASWWLFAREDLETLLTIHLILTAAGLLTIYVAAVKR